MTIYGDLLSAVLVGIVEYEPIGSRAVIYNVIKAGSLGLDSITGFSPVRCSKIS